MKARTARVHYLVTFVLALVGVVVFAAILGIATVFPFAYTSISEILTKKMAELEIAKEKRIPAVQAAKNKKAALKKEQAELKKAQKKLDKAKKKAMDKQVKKIYEERVANGYEASLVMIEQEAAKNEKAVVKEAKKSKKSKKEKKQSAVVVAPTTDFSAEPIAMEFASSADDSIGDFSSNGSMFRGISF